MRPLEICVSRLFPCRTAEMCNGSVSPVGEILSFAWSKGSTQRKGHPCWTGLRLPCAARRPGRRGNSPWQAAHGAACCGAQTPRAFLPRPAALLGGPEGALSEPSHRVSPSALPIWRVRTGKKRNPVRAPQQGTGCVPCQGELVERPSARAKSGTRRAAMRGRLSLVPFFGETKKGTRPKAKQAARTATTVAREAAGTP
jgi:hypothetical protein